MDLSECLAAVKALGLRPDVQGTGHVEWQRVFMQDAVGVQVGRVSLRNGQVEAVKWYGQPSYGDGGRITDYERWPWAWRLWVECRQRLDVPTWRVAVSRAVRAAQDERADLMAWRDANPLPPKADGKPRTRRRLQMNVRKHLARLLLAVEEV